MEFSHRIVDGWNIFTAKGQLSFSNIESVDIFSEQVKEKVKSGEYQYIFDFTDVDFIDSSGIAIVVLALSTAMKHGKPIKICGLKGEPRKSFEIIRVDFGIEYHDSLYSALKTLN